MPIIITCEGCGAAVDALTSSTSKFVTYLDQSYTIVSSVIGYQHDAHLCDECINKAVMLVAEPWPEHGPEPISQP